MEFHCRVRDHKLNRLAVRQGPAKGDTNFRVFDHHIQRALRDAHRTRPVPSDASLADPLLCQRKTATDIADDIGRRDANVFEENLPGRFTHHRWPLPFEGHARALQIDSKTGDAAASTFLRIGYGHQLDIIGTPGGGDEALGAVDSERFAVSHRACAHTGRIAAGVGFGLSEAKAKLSAQDRLEKTFLLLFIAVKQYRSYFRTEQFQAAKGQ